MVGYSELAVKEFYNQEDKKYQSFWSNDGSLHWGFFSDYPFVGNDKSSAIDQIDDIFIRACKRWDAIMHEKSGITSKSRVLDLGCGNGAISIWLAEATQAEVIGVDLSDVRILNAKQKLRDSDIDNVSFQQGSATALDFEDGYFTHVWSQATLCHIPKLEDALSEIYRVLAPNGVLVMDDLVQPQDVITADVKKYVYDRLLIGKTFSHQDYLESFASIGFDIAEEMDISNDLYRSYEILSERSKAYPENSYAYVKMCEAIDGGQLGWSFFKAEKRG